jgi:tape measure domain-containing protein
LLKLDPKNTELLKQKQDVLNQSIKTTEEKLQQLRSIKEEADKKMAEGTKINEENYRALQREIINTESKLKQLELSNDAFYKMGQKVEEFGNKINAVSEKINSLGNKLTTRLTLPIAAAVGAGISYNAELEKLTTAYSTFLGDSKEAEKVINQIKKDATKTPFDVTSLVKANQMLISTGENAEASQKTILALGDAVTATGGGNDELTRMASNLQQIKNAGKATAMDIRQFAYAGIDVYGLLADYLGKTTQEIKDMEISYEDLSGALQKASSQGGKYYNAMNKSSETLAGQTKQLKAQVKDMAGELTKSLMPTAKKTIAQVEEWIKRFDNLSDSQKENIVKIGLMVAAAGPLLKIIGTITTGTGKVVKGIGTVTKAIGLAKNGIGDATGAAANLAKVFQGLTSPAGIAAVGITTAVAIIITEIKKAEKETREKFSTMGQAASDFYTGLQSAEGYLENFNTTLFASAEEQENLKNQMDEVQKGITEICKTASDERRDYTQEEITQLDEYFTKLRELKNREIEIQNQIAGAITQQAVTNAETFQGSLEEYKVQSQEWISTAQQQADKTKQLIEQSSIEEVALLNQKYGEQANMQNEVYATEYNNLMMQKQQKIDAVNAEVAEITKAYANGYFQRSEDTKNFAERIKSIDAETENLRKNHFEIMQYYEKTFGKNSKDYKERALIEEDIYNSKMKKIYDKAYENMSNWEAEQVGSWIAQVTNAELYGTKLDEETKKTIETILNSYEFMPEETKKTMNEAMNGMLEGMKDKEPSLWAKASNIADGILSRLRKSFDIHSPSKKTRDIFQNVIKGAELGLSDEQKNLNKQVDDITNKMKTNFSNITPNMKAFKQSIIDQTKTIFTTPTLNIYAQDELTPAKINTIIDTVNRRLGSKY